MGCDIHVRIQRLNGAGWEDVSFATYLDRQYPELSRPVDDSWPTAPPQLTARNYDTFGILANVRNGRGFAGCKTGDGWPSIAPDRGLPSGINAEDDDQWLGDHSFTWMTLAELQAFHWDGVYTTLHGVVSREQYERWDKSQGGPLEYCGDVSGPKIRIVSEDAWLVMPQDERNDGTRWHIRVSWLETARQASNDFPGTVIPWLRQFGDPEAVRLVVGFDS
jgi:hypothetical protein